MKAISLLQLFFLLLLLPQKSSACGGDWDYNSSHHTFLDYFLLKNCVASKYFFYTGYKNHQCKNFEYYNYDGFEAQENEKDYNIADWQAMTSPNIKAEDIAQVLYMMSLDSLEKIKAGKIKVNSDFVQFILQKSAYLDYLIFAKKCEPQLMVYPEWEENPHTPDHQVMQNLFEQAENKVQQTTDLALKQRYLYQLIRLASVLNRENVQNLFEEYHQEQMPQSFIYGRILGRLAMSHIQKQPAQAKYLYAKIFDKYRNTDINFAEIAYMSFRKIDVNKSQWEECLALAKQPSEKATLWTLLAFQQAYAQSNFLTEYNPNNYPKSLVCLQEAHKIYPQSDLLETLLLREIQQKESSVLAANFMLPQPADSTSYQISKDIILVKPLAMEQKSFFRRIWDAILAFFSQLFTKDTPMNITPNTSTDYDLGYADWTIFPQVSPLSDEQKQEMIQLKSFVEKAAEKNQHLQNSLWHLMTMYLNILEKDYEKAKLFAQKVRQHSQKDQNPNIEKMLVLLENYLKLEAVAQIDEKFEQEQAQFWKNQKDTLYHFKEIFFNRLGQKYLEQNNLEKAILSFRNGSHEAEAVLLDMYLSEEEFAKYYEFVKNTNSDWVKYLHPDSPDYLLNVWAIRLARESQMEAAFEKVKSIHPQYWKSAFTFEANFGDMFSPQNKEVFNHLRFFQKIDSLQKIAQNNKPQALESYVQIGNALASTPFWGYSNELWKGNLLSVARAFEGGQYPLNLSKEWANKFFVGKEKFLRRYGTGFIASKFYEKAMNLDKNSDRAAQAAFLALSAYRKEHTSFHQLRHTETDLDYYKQIFGTNYSAQINKFSSRCPELKSFL